MMARFGAALLIAIPVGLYALMRADDNNKKAKAPPEPTKPPSKPDIEKSIIEKVSMSEFLQALPDGKNPNDLPIRSKLIRDEVIARSDANTLAEDDISWTTIQTSLGQYAASIPVMTDALKLDGVRVNIDFERAQQIADYLGIFLLTPKVSDLLHEQTMFKVKDSNHGAKGDWMDRGEGSWTVHMFEHSAEVDGRINDALLNGPYADWPAGWNDKLRTNVGKYWVNTIRNWEKQNFGANHGWYLKPTGIIQNRGMAHDVNHVDYSQVFRAMGPVITITDGVSGETFDLLTKDVLTSPEWAALISDEGPLLMARNPWIKSYQPFTAAADIPTV